jgi:hypothetical protein
MGGVIEDSSSLLLGQHCSTLQGHPTTTKREIREEEEVREERCINSND